MNVAIEVQCAEITKQGFDCGGNIASILKPLVSAIPLVGGFAAEAWDVGCAASKLANGEN